ncbi:MAG: TauD/TfdA dioxygenase family protein [Minwuia sp.]|uniref:TauD/TfdA dioxygenase family protein n=1 Tax=Minwuia sp. TaxID=2493630 RepID=UPI003A8C53E5
MSSNLDIRPVAGALGAEIHGVDLSKGLDTGMAAAVRQALLDHLVIFFRDQSLEAPQFLAFAEAFGEPVEYPFVKGIDACPQIIEVAKLEHEKTNFGGIWHSDTVYLQEPPMGSMLLARELPPYGGDTLFANQYLAYESLSETFRKLLDGLTAVHSSAKADVSKTREDRISSSGTAEAGKEYLSFHPAVRTHPETGRKALFVNTAHTVRFDGMTEAESEPILKYLYQHQIRPEFTCRFVWQPGSLAFWDNRCAQHNPVNDYHGFRRIMHRITLKGDKPA